MEISISQREYADGVDVVVSRPVLGYRTRIAGVLCHWQRPFWRLVHEGSGLGLSLHFLGNSSDLQEAIASLLEISEREDLDWTLDVLNMPQGEKSRYSSAVTEATHRVLDAKQERYNAARAAM